MGWTCCRVHRTPSGLAFEGADRAPGGGSARHPPGVGRQARRASAQRPARNTASCAQPGRQPDQAGVDRAPGELYRAASAGVKAGIREQLSQLSLDKGEGLHYGRGRCDAGDLAKLVGGSGAVAVWRSRRPGVA